MARRQYEIEVTWPNLPYKWTVIVEGHNRRMAQCIAYCEARYRFGSRQSPTARLVCMKGWFDKQGMPFPTFPAN